MRYTRLIIQVVTAYLVAAGDRLQDGARRPVRSPWDEHVVVVREFALPARENKRDVEDSREEWEGFITREKKKREKENKDNPKGPA
jgi:hypothetical protein